MNGCSNCRYFKCYPGSYYVPDDYECACDDKAFDGMSQDEIDTVLDRVWTNGEEWFNCDEPICPAWELKAEEPDWEY